MFEWRVQRQTKVSARKVLRTYRVIDRALRHSLETMLELHFLWHDESLPRTWWDAQPSLASCTYSNILFTDVNQPGFQLKLPMLLDDFVSHVEGHSKDIRDALLEFWIVNVGSKLSAAVSRLKDEKKMSETDNLEGDPERERLSRERYFERQRDSDEDSDDDASAVSGEHRKFQRALKSRMLLEGFEEGVTPNSGTSTKRTLGSGKDLNGSIRGGGGGGVKKNSAERMVSTAVVLLSRQLRGMCETSLEAIAELFERLPRPLTAEYSGESHTLSLFSRSRYLSLLCSSLLSFLSHSNPHLHHTISYLTTPTHSLLYAVFVINMRLRKKRTGEITSDFTEPVTVTLQPDLHEIKTAMTTCVQKIVTASRGFPRPEQSMSQTFGGTYTITCCSYMFV